MPDGMPNLLDLAQIEGGLAYPIINEAVKISPELQVVPADTIEGSTITLTVRTDLPSVAFRNANEGVKRSKSKYTERVFQTHILDHQVSFDLAMLRGRKPAAQARALNNHVTDVMEAAFQHISSQFYYGTGNDAKGFPGLIAQYKNDADHEVDAGGNSAKTSVWFMRLGPECAEFLFGNGRTIMLNDEWMQETVLDANSNPYQALTNWLVGNVGFRLANKNCAVRIKNIEEDTKTLDDALMFSAYEKFTEFGREPTHIFMNGRSREQLRKSRTATNPAGVPAPLPTEWEGIPIVRTAGITKSES